MAAVGLFDKFEIFVPCPLLLFSHKYSVFISPRENNAAGHSEPCAMMCSTYFSLLMFVVSDYLNSHAEAEFMCGVVSMSSSDFVN